MVARDLMRHEVVRVPEDMTLGELCDVLQHFRVHGAPVVDPEDRLLGFVSQEDILVGSMGVSRTAGRRSRAPAKAKRKVATQGADFEPRVRDVMTSPAVSATEDTPVVDLCQLMWRLRIHHVPILREGRVTGMVSAMDLCRAVSEGTIRV